MLYIPWRNENRDLYLNYDNYINAYNSVRELIYQKMSIYEPAAEIIQEAQIEFEANPHDYIVGHPLIEDATSNFDEEYEDHTYEILNPNLLPDYRTPDISADLHMCTSKYIDSVQSNPEIMDSQKYSDLVDSLNTKQYEFYLYIMKKALLDEEQQLVCLHGGAGTGKSTVINAIYQGLYRLLNKTPGDKNINLKSILVAPTGKAAYNIKGNTIHSVFHIPANQPLRNYMKLSFDYLNTYRSKYKDIKWIIIDEISMVSNYTLRYIHLRLQEIKGNELLFGGVNLVTVGDFFQLKPVMGQFIFEDYSSDYGPLANNLWKDNIRIFELIEIMRQKDDKLFAELLNRLRVGQHTKKDIHYLKATKQSNQQLASDTSIPHFFPTKEQVQFNNQQNLTSNTSPIVAKCTDLIPASLTQYMKNDITSALAKRKEKDTGGLSSTILLAIERQYDLISNIDVKDGLINGSPCCIKYIQMYKQSDTLIPGIVWVMFEDKNVGQICRSKSGYLYNRNVHKQWTPILRVKRSFLVKDHWIHRLQFPLRPAAARTIHVSQSSTYSKICVDLNSFKRCPATFWQHMHYVALSRVTSYKGLYIENLNENNISVSKKVLDYLSDARTNKQLDTKILYKGLDVLNITFNNARSFKLHHSSILKNRLILSQDISIFAESRLSSQDQPSDFAIDNFQTVRGDQKNRPPKPNYGIIAYIKHSLELVHVEYLSKEKIDIILIVVQWQYQNIAVVAVYNSPKNTYRKLEENLIPAIQLGKLYATKVVVIGDFNIDISSLNYLILCTELDKYQLKQQICKYTTKNKTVIDFCFTNAHVAHNDVFHCHWSDHNILHVQIK